MVVDVNLKKERHQKILSDVVGKVVEVHNGKEWKSFLIKSDMVGRKYGEYVFTRKLVQNIHIKKGKKK